ncbi:MAG: hypothetical protein Q8L41_11255 [Anaerolineales bacterium]|nr:hypothetical protein [Anaerolineales bacterium]
MATDPILIRDVGTPDNAPAWSPDGTKIAFVSSLGPNLSEIYIMNADGSNPIQITHNGIPDFEPAWSPDGTLIAISSSRDDGYGIYLIYVDGSNEIKLPVYGGGPAWSP